MSDKGLPALVCENVTMRFGGLTAVSEFNLVVPEGALYGLIGPNGAGKTTVFNVVSGVLHPSAGAVKLFGDDIAGLSPTGLRIAASPEPSRTSGSLGTSQSSTMSWSASM